MTPQTDNIIPFPGQPQRGALVLRVELMLVPYPVWRVLRIGDQATFWNLHIGIQDAMGWSHRHRHLFTTDHPGTGERMRLGIPEGGTYHGRGAVLPSWKVRVVEVVRADHPPFLYTYHLGEEWQHEVSLVAVESSGAAGPTPACLEGVGACPPEDCGGPEAFGVQFASGARGLPRGFDPDAFDASEVVFSDPGQFWNDDLERG